MIRQFSSKSSLTKIVGTVAVASALMMMMMMMMPLCCLAFQSNNAVPSQIVSSSSYVGSVKKNNKNGNHHLLVSSWSSSPSPSSSSVRPLTIYSNSQRKKNLVSLFSSSSSSTDNNKIDDNEKDDEDEKELILQKEISDNMAKRAYWKRIRYNIRSTTGVSITKIRYGLKQITGFSLRTFWYSIRTFWRGITGISLTTFYTSIKAIHICAWLVSSKVIRQIWHTIVGIFPLPIRYFLQLPMVILYMPINIASALTVSRNTRDERTKIHDERMEFYRNSVIKAQEYSSKDNIDWPIGVNVDTGEFVLTSATTQDTTTTADKDLSADINDAIMKSIHYVRSIEYEKTGVPQP